MNNLNSKLKGVIFDFNGVMIDDYVIQKEAWTTISQEVCGKSVTDEEMIGKIRGVPTQINIQRMANETGKILNDNQIEEIALRKDNLVQELFAKSPLVSLTKGLENFLNDLKKRNVPITIASSSSLKNLQVIFERFNLFTWFDIKTIIHKDSTLNGKKIENKPAPDPYVAASKLLDIAPEQCIVFEDAKSGITSALNAGVKEVIAINSNPDHLARLILIAGVVRGIHNFTEITVPDIFGNS